MTVRDILLLGDPRLYEVSSPVDKAELEMLRPVIEDLHDTMMAFRRKYGVGRAIAAPQIGVMKRLVYMHIDKPVIFINPSLSNKSQEMMEIWDDCMSFPDLLVRVYRHRRCRIEFKGMKWESKSLDLKDDMSELLQHECDHLDGVLAVSRAIDGKSFALASQRHLLQEGLVSGQ
jgi:peptide deformylase